MNTERMRRSDKLKGWSCKNMSSAGRQICSEVHFTSDSVQIKFSLFLYKNGVEENCDFNSIKYQPDFTLERIFLGLTISMAGSTFLIKR